MSAPADLMGRGSLADANRARQIRLETGGLHSMVRGFRKGVKLRRQMRRPESNGIAKQPDETLYSAPLCARWAMARVRGRQTADRRLRRPGSWCAPPSGSGYRWALRAPRLRLPHPVHRRATSRPGTAQKRPERSTSGFRNRGSAHSRFAYCSRRRLHSRVAQNCHKDFVTQVT
jgi:hypothetical protein